MGEDILLRDVIDLETTFGDQMGDGETDEPVVEAANIASAPNEKSEDKSEPELDADGNPIASDDDEDDEEQANMSLAAMEATLKPRVLETLDRIASDYEKLSEMQDSRISATLNEDGSFSDKQEKTYQKLRSEIVELVNSLHLHNNRIEALIDQLYGINRRIMQIDSAMVKLADQARINRKEFVDAYRGRELDPNWLEDMAAKDGRGWKMFMERSPEKVEELRADMARGPVCGPRHQRVPPDRESGAEGRERSPPGQEGNGRGQPAAGDLDRQEIHQPGSAIPDLIQKAISA